MVEIDSEGRRSHVCSSDLPRLVFVEFNVPNEESEKMEWAEVTTETNQTEINPLSFYRNEQMHDFRFRISEENWATVRLTAVRPQQVTNNKASELICITWSLESNISVNMSLKLCETAHIERISMSRTSKPPMSSSSRS